MNFYLSGFLINSVYISVFIFAVVFARKWFKNKVSYSFGFKIWYILMAVMFIPFLPFNFRFLNFNGGLSGQNSAANNLAEGLSQNTVDAEQIKDFAVSVNRAFPDFLNTAAIALYIIGVIAVFVMFLYSVYNTKKLRMDSFEADDRILNIFDSCVKTLGINKNVNVMMSDKIKSPVIMGVINPVVLLPLNIYSFKDKNIEYIILHELGHFKNKDIHVCCIMCLLKAFYWFNPVVWWGFKQMKDEMEILSDNVVLENIDRDLAGDYGLTMISFAEKALVNPYGLYAGFGSSKKQLKYRIENIAEFAAETMAKKIKGAALVFVLAAVMLAQLPNRPVLAFDNYYKTEKEFVNVDLSQYFDGINGTAVIYSPYKNEYVVYNKELSTKRVSPNSTYKIYSALSALENGIITPDSSEIKWDGTENEFIEWNGDQNLNSAMKNSVNWYFKELDNRNGYDNIESFLKTIGYGNCDFSGGNDFWLESSLKISAVEQVELLSGLYSNSFGCDEKNISAVKDSMFIGSSERGKLYGKTGTGAVNGKNVNGSFIGFVESGNGPVFFAVNMEGGSTGADAGETAVRILSYMGLY